MSSIHVHFCGIRSCLLCDVFHSCSFLWHYGMSPLWCLQFMLISVALGHVPHSCSFLWHYVMSPLWCLPFMFISVALGHVPFLMSSIHVHFCDISSCLSLLWCLQFVFISVFCITSASFMMASVHVNFCGIKSWLPFMYNSMTLGHVPYFGTSVLVYFYHLMPSLFKN